MTEKYSSGEIISPETPGINPLFQRHLAAYDFCIPYIKDKRVLEVGFGEGYGVGRLSEHSSSYDAVDVTDEWIESAKRKYGRENVTFRLYDGKVLPYGDQSFDVVISMQVIEHIKDYRNYLLEIKRVLRPSGMAILGTPNKKTMISGVNPYHYKEFSHDELQRELADIFKDIEIYGLFGSDRYMALKEGEQGLARKILAIDLFELRRFIPRALIRHLYATAFWFVNRMTEKRQTEKGGEIKVSDFYFSKEKVDSALDFMCICSNGD